MNPVDDLRKRWALPGKIAFENGPRGLPVARLTHQGASLTLSLYGAHVLSYVPAGEKDLLWVSHRSAFEEGKAIRGGVPVCFPWFGPHPEGLPLPQHGFARILNWTPCAGGEDENGSPFLDLELVSGEATAPYFAGRFRAILRVTLSDRCHIALTVTNTGTSAFEISAALHAYFSVSDIRAVAVEGLADTDYYEGFDATPRRQAESLLQFNGETNRRYVHTTTACMLADQGMQRKIQIEKSGSKVTVVWNPWVETASQMSDLYPEAYKEFLCIEPANAYAGIDIIRLEPAQTHTLEMTIRAAG